MDFYNYMGFFNLLRKQWQSTEHSDTKNMNSQQKLEFWLLRSEDHMQLTITAVLANKNIIHYTT